MSIKINSKNLLELRGVSIEFPGVKALENVDFSVRPGEIHALMGENGAGKSTLIKIITGVYNHASGSTIIDDQVVHVNSPSHAEKLGISCVFQEINLIPYLSVAENIMLGRQKKKFGLIDWSYIYRRAKLALKRVGLDIDVKQELSACSVAIQQMVAIARALDTEARILILDEPTASLDENEVDELFGVLRDLRQQGLAIVFVTHFLDQVYQISDRITVLRNGGLVGVYDIAELPRLKLVAKMLGRTSDEVEKIEKSSVKNIEDKNQKTFLEINNLARKGAVAPLSFTLKEGQIFGLAGLLGSGRTEIARMLFGVDKADSAALKFGVHQNNVKMKNPRMAIANEIAFCSEDRKIEGIIPNLSVLENIIVALQARRGPFRRLSISYQNKLARRYINLLDIKTPTPETPLGSLSGGNQQKVLLARWMVLNPKLMILDEPTRGIDIGAKTEIENLVQKLAKGGMSVVFISSELDEMVHNCQQIMVLRENHKVGEINAQEITGDKIMSMMAGQHE